MSVNNIMNGVEKLEIGMSSNGVIDQTSWITSENIEDGSVSISSNADTKTNIIPEDKDVAILVLYTPGDPDVFNFGLYEISPENLQLYFNVVYVAATSKILVLAKKKYATLAVRVTTRPQNGYKQRVTYTNCSCVPSFKNNLTKNGLLAIEIAGSILPYIDPASGENALWFIELLNEDGSAVDSTPPTVSAGADQTSSTTSKSLTGTATATSPKTIVGTLWTQVSGPNTAVIATPNALTCNMTGLVAGTYIFELTATDSVGIQNSDQTNVVVS